MSLDGDFFSCLSRSAGLGGGTRGGEGLEEGGLHGDGCPWDRMGGWC